MKKKKKFMVFRNTQSSSSCHRHQCLKFIQYLHYISEHKHTPVEYINLLVAGGSRNRWKTPHNLNWKSIHCSLVSHSKIHSTGCYNRISSAKQLGWTKMFNDKDYIILREKKDNSIPSNSELLLWF